MAPTTMEDIAVAIMEAAITAVVDTPEIMKVQQEPMREQKPKRPATISRTEVMKAIM